MSRLRTEHGTSLFEVMMSMTMGALVVSGLAFGTVASTKTNVVSKDTAAAAALIQDQIEHFRALDPAGDPADLTPGTHVDLSNPVTGQGFPGGYFTRTWTVTADTPRRGLSRVVVSVSWTTPQPRILNGVTYVCRTSTCS